MKNNNINILVIIILAIAIVYFIKKIISKQYLDINPNYNNIKLVKIDDFETTAEETTAEETTAEETTAEETTAEDTTAEETTAEETTAEEGDTTKSLADITENEFKENAKTIGDLLQFYNNANTNYYNEDNTDLTKIVKQINKVFNYLNPSQRINLSKRKLDEVYLEELKTQINDLTDNSTLLDNKILNTNTGIAFDTILKDTNFKVKIETDSTEDKCLDYDTNKLVNCDSTSNYLNFKKIPINTPKDFNNNLHPNLSFVKIKEDTIPFAHSIIQTDCDDCDDCIDNDMFAYDCDICGTDTKCIKCCKKYKKCLTVIKNKSNNGYTTYVEECNGRSAQQFY
jgi:hypothetical protein